MQPEAGAPASWLVLTVTRTNVQQVLLPPAAASPNVHVPNQLLKDMHAHARTPAPTIATEYASELPAYNSQLQLLMFKGIVQCCQPQPRHRALQTASNQIPSSSWAETKSHAGRWITVPSTFPRGAAPATPVDHAPAPLLTAFSRPAREEGYMYVHIHGTHTAGAALVLLGAPRPGAARCVGKRMCL